MQVIDEQLNQREAPTDQATGTKAAGRSIEAHQDAELAEAIRSSTQSLPDLGKAESTKLRVELSLLNSKY